MKLSICIAVSNHVIETKPFWGCLLGTIANKADTELLVVDNGSTDGSREWIERVVFGHFPNKAMLAHTENTGVIPAYQELYQHASGEALVYLHNDLFLFEHGWDERVRQAFTSDPRMGLAGFLGAEGLFPNGGRHNTVSNLLEAEIHGRRDAGVVPSTTFDALCLIARKTMLDELGGWDLSYSYNDFHDRDISAAAYFAGWHAATIGVFCHHQSGITATRPEYQEWAAAKMNVPVGQGGLAVYKQSEERFTQKWAARLPIWKPL